MPSGGRTTQKGFSLVELMVALVLGLVIVGGVINIFLSNQQAFRTNDQLGRLQENARISFEQMAREIRQAGGNACGVAGSPDLVSPLVSTDWFSNWKDAGAIQGFAFDEDATDIVPFGSDPTDRVEDTDAIKLLGGNLGEAYITSSPAATRFTLPNKHGLQASASSLFLACDASTAIIGTGTVNASATEVLMPNASKLSDGGFIAPYSAGFWYIGHNGPPRGGTSLYRMGRTGTQEIAEGVTDLQIHYLLRPKKAINPDDPPGAPDSQWLRVKDPKGKDPDLSWENSTGDAATGWIDDPDPAASSNPTKEVVAVRLTLKLQTQAAVGTNQQAVTRDLIHVVNLRNRGMR